MRGCVFVLLELEDVCFMFGGELGVFLLESRELFF